MKIKDIVVLGVIFFVKLKVLHKISCCFVFDLFSLRFKINCLFLILWLSKENVCTMYRFLTQRWWCHLTLQIDNKISLFFLFSLCHYLPLFSLLPYNYCCNCWTVYYYILYITHIEYYNDDSLF